jgi:hypothetical protein
MVVNGLSIVDDGFVRGHLCRDFLMTAAAAVY